MQTLALSLDILVIATTLLAAWLWFQASGRSLRRLSKHEELDASDLNRIVTAYNRAALLNRRAALATAAAAVLAGLRWALGLVTAGGAPGQ